MVHYPIDGIKKQGYNRLGRMIVALKELDNSKNIDSKALNEVRYPNLISNL